MKIYLVPSYLAPQTQNCLAPLTREVIASTYYYLAENIRTARRFITSFGVHENIRKDIHIFSLNKQTTEKELKSHLCQVPECANVGIISEAGCPAIADPGALAVAYAHQQGIPVIPLPGASAIILALMGSGFSGQQFAFHGYLPIEVQARQKKIKKLERESARKRQSQIFIETPYRNHQLLRVLLETCSDFTKLCIASNLTAPQQFIQTKTVAKWQKTTIDLHRIPTVFLLMV